MLLIALTACESIENNETKTPSLDRELQTIIDTFTGNYHGIAPNPAARKNPELPATMKVFHRVAMINAPQFGSTVVYHQMNRGDIDGTAIQRKIYTFDTTTNRPNNRMTAHYISPKQTWADLDQNPELIKVIQPEALMSFPIECIINWHIDQAKMIAEVKKEQCSYQSDLFKQSVRSDMSYTITVEGFDLYEAMYKDNGDTIFAMQQPISTLRFQP